MRTVCFHGQKGLGQDWSFTKKMLQPIKAPCWNTLHNLTLFIVLTTVTCFFSFFVDNMLVSRHIYNHINNDGIFYYLPWPFLSDSSHQKYLVTHSGIASISNTSTRLFLWQLPPTHYSVMKLFSSGNW